MTHYPHPFYATIVMVIGLLEPSACTLSPASSGKGDLYSDVSAQGTVPHTSALSIDQGSPESMGR